MGGNVQSYRNLLEKLDEYDSSAVELLQHILQQVTGTALYQPLRGLKKHLHRYKFEEAAGVLKPLLDQLTEME